MGAAFLCADLDLELTPRPDHVSYIANWPEVLKDAKWFILTTAAHARRAAGGFPAVTSRSMAA